MSQNNLLFQLIFICRRSLIIWSIWGDTINLDNWGVQINESIFASCISWPVYDFLKKFGDTSLDYAECCLIGRLNNWGFTVYVRPRLRFYSIHHPASSIRHQAKVFPFYASFYEYVEDIYFYFKSYINIFYCMYDMDTASVQIHRPMCWEKLLKIALICVDKYEKITKNKITFVFLYVLTYSQTCH